jgi:hypothetical protein
MYPSHVGHTLHATLLTCLCQNAVQIGASLLCGKPSATSQVSTPNCKVVCSLSLLILVLLGGRGCREDDDGLLPEWVVYHELVSTSRPFLRQVCKLVEACIVSSCVHLHWRLVLWRRGHCCTSCVPYTVLCRCAPPAMSMWPPC